MNISPRMFIISFVDVMAQFNRIKSHAKIYCILYNCFEMY